MAIRPHPSKPRAAVPPVRYKLISYLDTAEIELQLACAGAEKTARASTRPPDFHSIGAAK
jgi:hypothetical protein